jgi:hypothetical protein
MFFKQQGLKRHMTRHQGDGKKHYKNQCGKCAANFRNPWNLSRHLKMCKGTVEKDENDV